MSTAADNSVTSYVERISSADPQTALAIAVQETHRLQAEADKAVAEYRAMAELEFDANGRIVKANMAGLWRLARIYSDSTIVPEHYQGKPSDCFIACQMAYRLGVDPLAYMQNSYIVHGKPGIEAKLAIAVMNTSGKIIGRIMYERDGAGKAGSCRAKVKDRETSEWVFGAPVTWELVEAEGWSKKSGSKWNTMPDLMFQYRAAMFLIRTVYPDVLMGVRTVDELEDMAGAIDVQHTAPERPSNLDALTDRLEGSASSNGNRPQDAVAEGTVEAARESLKQQTEAKAEAKSEEPSRFIQAFDGELSGCATADAINDLEAESLNYPDVSSDEAQYIKRRCEEARATLDAPKGKSKQKSMVS